MLEQAQNIIIEKLKELQAKIASNIEASGKSASGRTAKSMYVEPTDNGAALKTSQGNIMFQTLETGRKAGKIPYNFRAIIQQWIIDKGISISPIPYIRKPSENWQPKYSPQERGELSLAGAIAHKIKTEGTKLFRDGGRADIYSNEIPNTVAEIKKAIFPILKAEVLKTIKINQ